MFLNELTREQQRAFVILVRQVMAADEKLAMQEVERLEDIYRETGLPSETADAPDVVLDLNYMFDTARARAVVFIELVFVAYADGVFGTDENRKLASIANGMNLEEDTRVDAINWVRRFMDIRKEGSEIGS